MANRRIKTRKASAAIQNVQDEIAETKAEIQRTRLEIKKAEHRRDEAQRTKKMKLFDAYRKDVEQLREKELLLLRSQQPAGSEPPSKRKRWAFKPWPDDRLLPDETNRLLDIPEDAWHADAGKEMVKGMGIFRVHHLYGAGRKDAESILAYARNEAVDLFNNVRQALMEKANVLVTGPPGCGKSVMAWQLACHMARRHDLQFGKSGVFWVRVTTGNASAVVSLLKASGIRTAQFLPNSDSLGDVLTEVSPELVVLDGITKETSHWREVVCLWCEEMRRQFVFVNSPQARFPKCDERILRPVKFLLYAWMEKDLHAAFNDANFYNSVISKFDLLGVASELPIDTEKLDNRDYLFLAKFMLAGHSARWMFEWTPKEVLAEIKECLRESLPNASHAGECSANASNSLFCTLKPSSGKGEETIATSTFILCHFLTRSKTEEGTKFLRTLTMFSQTYGNASFDGFVLALDFRLRLHRKGIITLQDADGKDVPWGVNELIPLDKDNNLADVKTYLPAGDVWLMPVNWDNCPSFDFVCVNPALSDTGQCVGMNLRVVQITKAKHHSFDYDDVRSLIKRLAPVEAQQVEVCVVFPSGTKRPKMTTTASSRTDCRWQWGEYKFLTIVRKGLLPMDMLASLELKRT